MRLTAVILLTLAASCEPQYPTETGSAEDADCREVKKTVYTTDGEAVEFYMMVGPDCPKAIEYYELLELGDTADSADTADSGD